MPTKAMASSCSLRTCRATAFGSRRVARVAGVRVQAARTTYKVEVEYEGKTIELKVPEGESILSAALDKNIYLPHDCKLGVCMTCPAKLISGKIDQSGAMLSDDVVEKGYALMCMAQPKTDCKITVVSEEELLDLQLATSG